MAEPVTETSSFPGTTRADIRVRSSLTREIVETALLTGLLFLIAHFSMQNFQVDGLSMKPTLSDRKLILVDKLTAHFHPGGLPNRGDVVVFVFPNDHTQDFIKRVIGLPGDVVSIRQVHTSAVVVNHVFVNGRMLNEPYISAPPDVTIQFTQCFSASTCSYKVPSNFVFVMGDNRPESYDSRAWGPVPVRNIIGRAAFSYWQPQAALAGVIPCCLSFAPINNQFYYATS